MVPPRFSGYTWAGNPQFMLDRCLDCNASLKKEETECFACGATVKSQRSGSSSFGQRFATLLKYGFIGSAVLTVASLFFDATPSFGKCITATLVLLLAKSSADQMLERKSG